LREQARRFAQPHRQALVRKRGLVQTVALAHSAVEVGRLLLQPPRLPEVLVGLPAGNGRHERLSQQRVASSLRCRLRSAFPWLRPQTCRPRRQHDGYARTPCPHVVLPYRWFLAPWYILSIYLSG